MACTAFPSFIAPRLVGDPVDTLTGAAFDRKFEFRLTGPLELWWYRHYNSDQHRRRFALGWGHTHDFDRVLYARDDGFIFESPVGIAYQFATPAQIGDESISNGYRLKRVGLRRFHLFRHGEPGMEFDFDGRRSDARLRRLFQGTAEIEFHYSPSGSLVGIVDAVGRLIDVEQGADGLLRSVTLRDEERATRRLLIGYEYDDAGNLVATKNAHGAGHTFIYDAANRLVRLSGRKGFQFRFAYDASGRCVTASGDENLYGVTLSYGARGRKTVVKRADGGVWVFSFDARGSLLQVVNPLGGRQQFIHDARGRVVMEVDPNGSVTRIEYDAAGAEIARVGPYAQRVSLPEDPNAPDPQRHRVASNAAEYTYGRMSNPCRIRVPDVEQLASLQLSADVAALVLVRLNDVPRQTDGAQCDVRPLGLRWWPEPRAGHRFDEFGKLIEQYDARGRRRTWMYDAAGNVAEHVDFDGGRWLYDYGSWHLIRAVTDPLGATVRYSYNTNARAVTFTDAGGSVSEYVYDLADQLIEVRRHGVVRDTYVRDPAGALRAKRAGDGRELLRFEIGQANLPVRRTLASGDDHGFTYDDRGRHLVVTTKKDRVEFAYDQFGHRVRDHRNSTGLVHRFHRRNRLAETVFFDRFRVSYEVRPGGGTRIIDPAGGVHETKFDRIGLATRRFSSGTHEIEQYDNLGRCLFKHARLGGGRGRIWTRRYHWSGEGELRRSEDTLSGDVQYEHDAAHRLRRRQVNGRTETFELDAAGNLLAQPGLTKVKLLEGNRLAAANGHTFEYNDRNHVATYGCAEGPLRFIYDSRDQLSRIESAKGVWQADYDALGRRTRKTWAGCTTEYYWSTDQLAAEVGPNGHVRLYVYPDPLAMTPFLLLDYESLEAAPDACERYFVLTDQIGTPTLIENVHGAEVWRARIEPYGRVEVAAGSTIECHLRFPGHYFDEETGLHYNRFRYYDPTLGRYLQSDPLGVVGGYNLYAYPANPMAVADVRGLGEGGQDNDDNNKDKNKQHQDDEPPPPGKPPKADDDATPPLMSKEDAEALARQKNGEYRAELDAKIAAGEMSQKDAGPVAATVVDRRTGEVSNGHNDRNGNPPDPMHPLIDQKIKDAQANPLHPSEPGSHAEVHALNDALNKREEHNKQNGLPPVTNSDLDEFTQVSEWRKGSGDNRMKPGDDAPRCGNCQTCTDGVDNRSGDAPPWPPPWD